VANIPGIRVKQWLPEWGRVPTDPEKFQSPPPREFYVTSVPASQLRALSDVHQRAASVDTPREQETAVQRTLEVDRTIEIRKYIRNGYPLSSLGSRRMSEVERDQLRKPGWLPTAIIANIVPAGDTRGNNALDASDAMSVTTSGGAHVSIELPLTWAEDAWKPAGAYPLEIIDGQHRLSAFDADGEDDFELPVVLFVGLDFSWQAYLFWTVNIKPKRINASLAFDLYPLLREQDWLDAGEALNVYRETRGQELVEALWGNPESVWYDRVNMLGQTGMKAQRPVSQAAFVRSLTTTMVRPFRGNKGFGGLFGGSQSNSGFNWPRAQQSAFLLTAWNELAKAIHENDDADWAIALRGTEHGEPALWRAEDARSDPAFIGAGSLLASDQGVRGFHMVLNDLAYLAQESLDLRSWRVEDGLEASVDRQFAEAMRTLQLNHVGDFLHRLGAELASFDWRNSRAVGLTKEQKEERQALRGSGGYNVLRTRLFRHLMNSTDAQLAALAQAALEQHNG
jgi:DGQHR domain-containing protein